MKKLLSLLLAALFTTSLFAACNSPGAPAAGPSASGATVSAASAGDEKPQKMTVWFKKLFSDEVNENFVKRCEDFGAQNGIEMEVTLMSVQDMPTEFAANLEAGVIPDLAMTSDYLVAKYYDDPPFIDIGSVLEEIETENSRKFIGSAVNSCIFNGTAYRIPFNYSTNVLYVRKDLMEKAGLELPKEWTFDDIYRAAPALTDAANNIYGLGVGMGSDDNDGLCFMLSGVWADGGAFYDKNGLPCAAAPENVKAVQKFIDAWKAGAISPDALSSNDAWNNQQYLTGTQAIVLNAPSLAGALKGDDYKELLENTQISLAPKGPSGRFSLNDWCFGFSVFKNCQSPDWSKKLLKFIYEGDWYDQYFDECAPTVIPVFEDSNTKGVWTDPVNSIVFQCVQNSTSVSYGHNGDDSLVGLQNGMLMGNQRMLNLAVQRCMIDGMPVEDSLKLLQKEMEAAIAANH